MPAAVPDIVPEPAYAPAAEQYQPQDGPVPYNPSAYETKAYAEQYQALPQDPYQQPIYADGSPAQQNPYLGGAMPAYQPEAAAHAPLEYAGPQGDIPILGKADYKPYNG